MQITCQKQFPSKADYSEHDTCLLDWCIKEGIESIKKWVIRCEGCYTLIETKDTITIIVNESDFIGCFEDVVDGTYEFNSFINGITSTIDNYGIIFTQE